MVRRTVRWAKNVAQGKEERLKSGTEAMFSEGATGDPPPGGRHQKAAHRATAEGG